MRQWVAALCLCAWVGACSKEEPPRPQPRPVPPAPAPAPPPTADPVPEPPASPPRPEKKLALRVAARTWRTQPPHDIARALAEKLAWVAVEVTPPESQDAHARADVQWTEERAGEYVNVFDSTKRHGTKITFTIVLRSGDGTELLKLDASGQTGSTPSADGLFEEALGALVRQTKWSSLPCLVGGALGVRLCLPDVVSATLDDDVSKDALKILERAGYRPANAAEEGTLALARRNYAECVRIGAPAVPALVRWFHPYRLETDDVAAALAEIRHSSATAAFVQYLEENRRDLRRREKTLSIVLKLLAERTATDALPILDELAQESGPTGKQTGEAAAEIRARAKK